VRNLVHTDSDSYASDSHFCCDFVLIKNVAMTIGVMVIGI